MLKYLFLIMVLNGSCYGNELIDQLIPALIEVESGGNDKAVGDNGRAYGCLQIWDIAVNDVNRVYGTTYSHDDMLNRNNSIEVCIRYLTHWGKRYTKKTGKVVSLEAYARMWNGGPNGYNNPRTEKYWKKVLLNL